MAEPPNMNGMDTTPPRTFEAAAVRAAIPITEAALAHVMEATRATRSAGALAAIEDAYADLYADLMEAPLTDQYANLAGRILASVDTPTGAAIDEIIELVVSKQHDYGHGNILAFGHTGLVVRLSDKLARLKNLMGRGTDPLHESIEDTWMDMVGYCLIGIMLATDTFTLPLIHDQAAWVADLAAMES